MTIHQTVAVPGPEGSAIAAPFEVHPGVPFTAPELAAFIADVIVATYPVHCAIRSAAKTVEEDRVERLLESRTWFSARAGGRVLGVAAVHVNDDGDAYLSSHFVAARGCGVGTALTAARLDWARTAGAASAVTTTHPWNTASLRNLARFGFSVVDRSPDLWLGDGDGDGDGDIVTLRAAL